VYNTQDDPGKPETIGSLGYFLCIFRVKGNEFHSIRLSMMLLKLCNHSTFLERLTQTNASWLKYPKYAICLPTAVSCSAGGAEAKLRRRAA
jgi:hypothetical protein